MAGMRRSWLVSLSNRLERICEASKARYFGGASVLLLGGFLGGLFGLIPFYSASDRPSRFAQTIYIGALGFALVLAIVCGVAHKMMSDERGESVSAIKQDIDDMLDAYVVGEAQE